MNRLRALLSASVVVVALGAAATPAGADSPKVGITGDSITSYAFMPKTLHVSKGTKVGWSWQSNAPHNVTFSSLGEHSKSTADGSFELKFKKPGTYKYECTIHGFKGKVVVGK